MFNFAGSPVYLQFGKEKFNSCRIANGGTIIKPGLNVLAAMQQYEEFDEEDTNLGIDETFANYTPLKRE